MKTHIGNLTTPRAIGVVCAIAATGLGLLYLAAAGAPAIQLAVNGLALVMGLALFAVIPSFGRPPRLPKGIAVLVGGLLLTTALFGASVEGASRWISIGGLSLQISLIVLPAMLVVFARSRDLLSTIGMVLGAVALALQPDRAMAGVLVCALAALGTYRQDRWVVSALVVAVIGFTTTLIRPDSLPAVPYVDRILYTAFEVHAMVGTAVVGGALLLIVPAIAGRRIDPKNGEVYAVFGTVWLSVVAAAALGNYPTPVVGYGGSAILGYAFSLSFLPKGVRSAAVVRERVEGEARTNREGGSDLRMDVLCGKGPGESLHQSPA